MNSVAKKRPTNKKGAHDRRLLAKARREERPVEAEIKRAAKRAGIGLDDSTTVTVMRGDLALAASHIRAAFDDVLTAETSDDGGQHDVLILRALRSLRNAQSSVECEMDGVL